MKRLIITLVIAMSIATGPLAAKDIDPVAALAERIQGGASSRFVFELTDQSSPEDFFELSSKGGKIVIKGNNNISIATGLNWYLKYHAGIHVSWNNPHPKIPARLPKIETPERHSTDMLLRYYLNYCTFSYSMAFWDWRRWEQEIDLMALHGINLPLSITGTATVWRNTLRTLGYDNEKINRFIAGPAHQAWWLMNNLEAWGGPNTESWYEAQAALERKIVDRYRELGIEPVFAGYAGMVPSDAATTLGLNVQDPGLWCGYKRPAFLLPTDPKFRTIADTYYKEQTKLFGTAKYYAIDPFHEGGSVEGVDLPASGRAIYDAMKGANPMAVWVAQAWASCPHPDMIRDLPGGDVLVLDLFSESRPMWGDPKSPWLRTDGYGRHDWIYCTLGNFGGNVGMHGKLQRIIDGYYMAKEHKNGEFLRGVGCTSEAIENNAVTFELIYELPWRPAKFSRDEWIASWVKARYGHTTPQVLQAWEILSNTVFDAPYESVQEGCTESVLCARPALRVDHVSTWGSAILNYDAKETERALGLMLEVSDRYRGGNNFEYDLVEVARQALADRANLLLRQINQASDKGEKVLFSKLSDQFLSDILLQDSLMGSRKEFMVGTWIESAMRMGHVPSERDFYRWNARTLITTWGDRHAANVGGLADYSYREWNGILRDLYYPRWKTFFDALNNGQAPPVDFYPMEAEWSAQTNPYSNSAESNPIDMAWNVYRRLQKPQ